jgi:hypothetical protein
MQTEMKVAGFRPRRFYFRGANRENAYIEKVRTACRTVREREGGKPSKVSVATELRVGGTTQGRDPFLSVGSPIPL